MFQKFERSIQPILRFYFSLIYIFSSHMLNALYHLRIEENKINPSFHLPRGLSLSPPPAPFTAMQLYLLFILQGCNQILSRLINDLILHNIYCDVMSSVQRIQCQVYVSTRSSNLSKTFRLESFGLFLHSVVLRWELILIVFDVLQRVQSKYDCTSHYQLFKKWSVIR